MENNPLVSIGLTTYNRPLLFQRMLDSLLSQTYRNIEIIIGDNSENNETKNIYEKYAADTRIKYYKHDKNIGMLANGQFVCDMANGKYFMFSSDDDYWDSTFIEKAVEKLENDPEAVACWPQVQFFDDNGVINNLPSSSYNLDLSNDNSINRLIKLNLQQAWCEFFCLVKTDIAKKFKPENDKVIGGDVIFVNLMALSGKCLFINETLFYYKYDPTNGNIRHNYKSEIYNEYCRINPMADLFVKCFCLAMTSKKLNVYEKLFFYGKYWAKILLSNRGWMYNIAGYPIKIFFMLAIRKRNLSLIFIFMPFFLFFFMSKIKKSFNCKNKFRKLIH